MTQSTSSFVDHGAGLDGLGRREFLFAFGENQQ
jgi:hypothetical protein